MISWEKGRYLPDIVLVFFLLQIFPQIKNIFIKGREDFISSMV